MNHRDHRKILIIDGKVAFSGGANLADEYINKKVKNMVIGWTISFVLKVKPFGLI